MKKLLLVLLMVLASAGAFSGQSRYAVALRERNAGLHAQLSENERIALQLERQNEAARKLIAENEAALLALETKLAAVARLSTASALSASDSAVNRWRDEVPFVRLSKEHLQTLTVRTLARDATNGQHLAAPAATLFCLSPAELSAINEAIRNLCEQYLGLEMARASMTQKPERSRGSETVFAIPRLQSEGTELKAAFTKALAGAIGSFRADLLLHYSHDTISRQLSDFGQNPKTITLVAKVNEQGGEHIKAYVNLHNGGYNFTLPPDDDPNAVLCRALWERAEAVKK